MFVCLYNQVREPSPERRPVKATKVKEAFKLSTVECDTRLICTGTLGRGTVHCLSFCLLGGSTNPNLTLNKLNGRKINSGQR